MDLIIYNQQNAIRCCQRKPLIRFHRASGTMFFSKSLCDKLEIVPARSISFCQDKKKPSDWYLLLDESNGFTVRDPRKTGGGLLISNKEIACRVLNSTGVLKACSFPIASEPTIIDNKAYWPIITENKIKEI